MRPSPSYPYRVIVSIHMTDRDVLEKVARLLGVSVYDVPETPRTSAWRPSYRVILSSAKAARFMRCLYPLMGGRRQGQIASALQAREEALSKAGCKRRLTSRQRLEIAYRLRAGEHAVKLAGEFSITREYVYRIARRCA